MRSVWAHAAVISAAHGAAQPMFDRWPTPKFRGLLFTVHVFT
jgi:hypothetical protein